MKNILIMFTGSLCAWFCGCPPEDDYIPVEPKPVDKIAVLVVDDKTEKFEGGGYYYFDSLYPNFTLNVDNIPANNSGFVKVNFKEADKTLYFATQINNGKGEIIVPRPFEDANNFYKVETEDFFNMPNFTEELTNFGHNQDVKNKWHTIQNLWVIRNTVNVTNNKIYYFKQDLNGDDKTNTKWVFITKF